MSGLVFGFLTALTFVALMMFAFEGEWDEWADFRRFMLVLVVCGAVVGGVVGFGVEALIRSAA